jgi:sugar phosphate isomerase/epimerase
MKLAGAAALSTRFMTDRVMAPEAILDLAERAHADWLVLDAGLASDLYEPLQLLLARRRDQLPLLAMESPCPRSVREGAREPQLCAPDRDEARAALEAALATVQRAGEARARFVVVALGEVRPAARDWQFARDRFLRADLDDELAQRLVAARDAVTERTLDGARRALETLARAAERAGVTLALRNGRRYVDVPSPRELDRLRADLAGAPLAPMLDVAAAHLTDVMGFHPLALTLAAWEKAPLVYFGDACGPIGALAPGRGIVDLKRVREAIDDHAAIAFNPWPGLEPDEVVAALPLVKKALKP